MASWGISWGTSWGSSWGASVAVAAHVTVGSSTRYRQRSRYNPDKQRFETVLEEITDQVAAPASAAPQQPLAVPIAALVKAPNAIAVQSIKANDDEEAIMVLLLAA